MVGRCSFRCLSRFVMIKFRKAQHLTSQVMHGLSQQVHTLVIWSPTRTQATHFIVSEGEVKEVSYKVKQAYKQGTPAACIHSITTCINLYTAHATRMHTSTTQHKTCTFTSKE